MDKFNEEKEYLKKVLEILNIEIEAAQKKEEELQKTYKTLSYEDIKRGDGLNMNSLLQFYGKRAYILQKSVDTPYFGRIDVKIQDENNVNRIYIGKSSLDNNGNTYVTDWRAPICSIYYDSEVGKTQYTAHSEIYDAELLLKRQLIIEKSKLLDVLDTNLVTNDELLKPYLSVNADNQMKTIVSSIQKEQNAIIRKEGNRNIVVQGVAGSGKTSVALHRISYLVYDRLSKMKSDEFLIVGPNKYFLKYIAGILPELETDPVEQNTYFQLVCSYTNSSLKEFKYNLSKVPKHELRLFYLMQKVKSSLDYKVMLEKYIDDYISSGIYQGDFIIDGEIVFSKEDIIKILFSGVNTNSPQIDRALVYFMSRLKNNIDDIYNAINKKYRDVYLKLPIGSKARDDSIKKSNELRELVYKKGVSLLKEYFKKMKDKPIDLYTDFINNIEKYNTILTDDEIKYFKTTTIAYLKKKQITTEDLPSLMFIKSSISGDKMSYRHIVVDEAQDYGLFHFAALRDAAPMSYFSIYGDLAQSIYSYRGISSWDDVQNIVFDTNCELLQLNKSYRTTIEITNAANCILKRLNMPAATPVVRHGERVSCYNGTLNQLVNIQKIFEWLNKGYKSIALICRDDVEAKQVCNVLEKNGIDAHYLNNNEDTYYGGVSVLTSADSKGLEFDGVIITDASEGKYLTNSDYDMHLLYVASTRALHELRILYKDTLTDVLKNNEYIDYITSNNVMKRVK